MGKDNARNHPSPLSTHVVMELMKVLEGKGYHVYMDNFYASPALCKYLFFPKALEIVVQYDWIGRAYQLGLGRQH